ncbi:MAG: ATP-binding protein, partial [Rubricoccaceae bacterium]|nr:ATP-binding protein [Rubricoccaceae bacterium]
LIATLYGLYAEASAATITAHSAGVPESRLVYLGLVTFLCTSMSASLYVSRYEQYRAFRTVDRLKANLSARSEALQRAVTRSKQMQDKLVQQEKLASLGQLTAGIAHEIKNPLNFVNNFAHLSLELVNELDEDLSSNPDRPVREALSEVGDVLADLRTNTHKIAEHGQRADGIVKSMLAHSRTTPGDRRAVSLHKLLDEYVNLAYHGMRAQHRDFNVEIQREYDQSIGEIDLVPEEMGRVILNLLDNAFDAVRLVSREENGFNPIVTVTTKASENGAVIMISDNGRGIPEELRERIFEPFFTTKPSGEGTGLGLSLAYEIVTAGHGGSMDVRTSTSGTTFTVELPEDAEQSEDADEEIDT